MAGIVKSTKRRFLIGKRIKEVEVPSSELDTDLFFEDLMEIGGTNSTSITNAELNRLPTLVKNEAVIALAPLSRDTGQVRGFNGDTKSVEFFSFARGSSGSVFRVAGNLALDPAGIVRLEHRPDNGQVLGYMFEKASSNLLTDSGVLDGLNSFTSKSSVGLTAVDTGFTKGALLEKGVRYTRGSQNVYGYKEFSLVANKTYVFSFYIKKIDNSQVTTSDFSFRSSIPSSNIVINSAGNNVYRVSVNITGDGSILYGVEKKTSDSNIDFIISGLQVEEGSIATSYIPTTDAAATRLADKLTSQRPIAVYPKNSFYMESDGYTGWFGNGVDWLDMSGRNLALDTGLIRRYVGENKYNQYVVIAGIKGQFSDYLKNGDIVTASFDLSVSGNTTVNQEIAFKLSGNPYTIPGMNPVYNPADGNGSFKIQKTFAVTQDFVDSLASYFYLILDYIDGVVEVSNFKFEKGSVATPWSPAPEDLVRIDANGNLTVESNGSDHLRSLSLVPRALTQEEI